MRGCSCLSPSLHLLRVCLQLICTQCGSRVRCWSQPAADSSGQLAQVKVDAQAVKKLRQMSGAGMMDAKKALLQTGGDVDKALEHLRKKGLASADKKAGRLASEGAIGAYIHAGSRCGILLRKDIACLALLRA